MSWPTTLSKTHLDEPGDDPSQARAELVSLLDAVNEIIALRGALAGICDLDAAGLIPVSRLLAVIDNTALQTDCVREDHIKAGEVNFMHLNATLTNSTATPSGGADGDLHFIYE